MPVGDLCHRDPVVARPEESAREVATRLDQSEVGCAVVVDLAGRPLGIITDRDLVLNVLRRGLDPDTTPIGQVMSDEVVTVREGSPLKRALGWMRRDGIRRIPVVDDEGKIAGVLAWDDALQVIADEVNSAAAVARTQIRK
ncbi:MAG: CBS domain-containing protein [Myxococcota bacterium]